MMEFVVDMNGRLKKSFFFFFSFFFFSSSLALMAFYIHTIGQAFWTSSSIGFLKVPTDVRVFCNNMVLLVSPSSLLLGTGFSRWG